ncbi:MAG TPA: ACT domain-containing protein [Blastocatellia bacterium]|nr:ACT domain-containing protein [Blastocatellia bacterium]
MPVQLDLPPTLIAVVSLPLERFGDVLTAVRTAEGYVSVTRDKDEVTLIIAEDLWHEMASNFPSAQVQLRRRMIRFDTVLDFSVVGFIAEISRALAEADISILSVSTYRTDAVLVHEAHYDRALSAVRQALVTLHHTVLMQH